MTIILIVLLILTLIIAVAIRQKLQGTVTNLSDQLTKTEQEKLNLTRQTKELEEQKNAITNKYKDVIDAENSAKEILSEAQNQATTLTSNAKLELETATKSAAEIKDIANKTATEIKQNAESLLSNANAQAKLVIDDANKKAEEIAGDAYKAMQNATEFEKTAKAMKNIIEGYGDRYLIPTYSLLDDLAEEFAYTDAGEKLKSAREKTNLMIKTKAAAKCDYVEANRKETAINFVLDAFNGKVDSILSKVKKDNYGTLEQKIVDAFQVVNNHGQAFRNAAITADYLKARVDELKWAVITQELKWQEQEEQRRIKLIYPFILTYPHTF
jgi:hypothetical protein